MEILCITCLHAGKRRSCQEGEVWLFPCNHVFCETHGKSETTFTFTSCPQCGCKGVGRLVDFARLRRLHPEPWTTFVARPAAAMFQAARRALAFTEVNSRAKAELVACNWAYKSLLADQSRSAMESKQVIDALRSRIALGAGGLGSLLLPQKRDLSEIADFHYKKT